MQYLLSEGEAVFLRAFTDHFVGQQKNDSFQKVVNSFSSPLPFCLPFGIGIAKESYLSLILY